MPRISDNLFYNTGFKYDLKAVVFFNLVYYKKTSGLLLH